MNTDTADNLEATKLERQNSGARRRDAATAQHQQAKELAASNGMTLRRIGGNHYQLEHVKERWLINLYPGNRRIHLDEHRPRAPFLRVPAEWTLIEVVQAAIAKQAVAK